MPSFVDRLAVDVPAAALSALPRRFGPPARRPPGRAVAYVLLLIVATLGFLLYLFVTSESLRDAVSGAGRGFGRWIVFALIVAMGAVLFLLRRRGLAFYAVLELGFAVAMAWDAAAVPDNAHTLAFAGKLVGAMYLAVRSGDNLSRAIDEVRGAEAGSRDHAIIRTLREHRS